MEAWQVTSDDLELRHKHSLSKLHIHAYVHTVFTTVLYYLISITLKSHANVIITRRAVIISSWMQAIFSIFSVNSNIIPLVKYHVYYNIYFIVLVLISRQRYLWYNLKIVFAVVSNLFSHRRYININATCVLTPSLKSYTVFTALSPSLPG